MFADAVDKANNFTRPIVISFQKYSGKCETGIGAFVVINKEGWVVTAGHILQQLNQLGQQAIANTKKIGDMKALQDDSSLTRKERQRQERALKPKQDEITKCSAWWSFDGSSIDGGHLLGGIDIGFAQLRNFDPSWISEYPIFNEDGLRPGQSLCRIGYPFHTIVPVYNEVKNSFELPEGALPLPVFPNEGLFTRFVRANNGNKAFPFQYIETSSPGLKGQSGGPIFDLKGRVCGIQSHTSHYPLGFSPDVPGGKKGEKEHQFLNVGRGVDAVTVAGAMRELGIDFTSSSPEK